MGMLKFVMFCFNIVISCLVINLVFINIMLNIFYILFYFWKFIIWFSVNKFDLNVLNNSRISCSRKFKCKKDYLYILKLFILDFW